LLLTFFPARRALAMIKKLKRIAPLKFGLILGILYGLIALIFVPFILLAAVVGSMVAPTAEGSVHQAMGIGVAIVLCFVLPVFYAVIGGLCGMLIAWIYNVIAGWVGGVEFEVE
jgi:hypothetical protein